MAFVNWEPQTYTVGSVQMDDQHEKLFEIINRYAAAMDRKASRAELANIFDEVVSFAAYHFKDEEAMMARNNYPDLPRHKLIHEALVKQVTELKQELSSGEAGAESKIKFFLKSWLTAHIKGIDTKYSRYLH
ncbi:MAG: hemerythrin family protein [Polyangiaceae bacterium]|nr:hemerythrin family protein [Myxococcales bacterium]MCB9586233.1 hemerythrin family protein [Polyangiaceae bacterium]MCB9606910.1 hemerythrin family protein [Polyangiaceae bacterium]